MRPFKPLVYFQPQMKEILATLEEKWSDIENVEDIQSEILITGPRDTGVTATMLPMSTQIENETSTSDIDDDDDDQQSLHSVDSNAEDQELLMDGVDALRDMRCYVDFVDNEVMPLYTQYDGTSARKVRFEDLWALFRVGDVVYVPAGGDDSGRYHELWRVYRVSSPEPDSM